MPTRRLFVGSLSVALACAATFACSSAPPPPPPQPTTQQIRGDSDRFFDKMKQEEKDHGAMK